VSRLGKPLRLGKLRNLSKVPPEKLAARWPVGSNIFFSQFGLVFKMNSRGARIELHSLSNSLKFSKGGLGRGPNNYEREQALQEPRGAI
jgi:hypothetical protein